MLLQRTAAQQIGVYTQLQIQTIKRMASTSTFLATSSCEPCKGDSPSIPSSEYSNYLSQLSPSWRIESFSNNTAPALQRDFRFKNFKQAMQFGNTIGDIAEMPGIKHHPAIVIEWGKVTCAWWTHAINGVRVFPPFFVRWVRIV